MKVPVVLRPRTDDLFNPVNLLVNRILEPGCRRNATPPRPSCRADTISSIKKRPSQFVPAPLGGRFGRAAARRSLRPTAMSEFMDRDGRRSWSLAGAKSTRQSTWITLPRHGCAGRRLHNVQRRDCEAMRARLAARRSTEKRGAGRPLQRLPCPVAPSPKAPSSGARSQRRRRRRYSAMDRRPPCRRGELNTRREAAGTRAIRRRNAKPPWPRLRRLRAATEPPRQRWAVLRTRWLSGGQIAGPP